MQDCRPKTVRLDGGRVKSRNDLFSIESAFFELRVARRENLKSRWIL
jgi:hypothetical protein